MASKDAKISHQKKRYHIQVSYSVLDKAGEAKVLERYVLVSNSEIKAGKEHQDHDTIDHNYLN